VGENGIWISMLDYRYVSRDCLYKKHLWERYSKRICFWTTKCKNGPMSCYILFIFKILFRFCYILISLGLVL